MIYYRETLERKIITGRESLMKDWLGFEKWFDFSHEHTFGGKVGKWLIVFGVDIIWITAATLFLLFVGGFGKAQLNVLIAHPIGQNTLYANLLTGTLGQPPSIGMVFFLACVLAPLWEEVAFRVFPIFLARKLTPNEPIEWCASSGADRGRLSFLFWACCFSSIIFGLMHGSVINILFQGMGGFLFSWLYLKNNCSYWSAVAAHGLWNFMVIFGFRIWVS